MPPLIRGDTVEVTGDLEDVIAAYFPSIERWKVGLIYQTTDGLMAALTRLGNNTQHRNALVSRLKRVELV